jgi:hypothetical protein
MGGGRGPLTGMQSTHASASGMRHAASTIRLLGESKAFAARREIKAYPKIRKWLKYVSLASLSQPQKKKLGIACGRLGGEMRILCEMMES